jgi:hypothetical protein
MSDEYQVRREIEEILQRLGIEGSRIVMSSKLDINAYARRPALYMMRHSRPEPRKITATVWLPRKLNMMERQTLRRVEQRTVVLDIRDKQQ